MKYAIEYISDSNIAYMRRTGPYGEGNYRLMAELKEWVKRHGLWNGHTVIYGIARDNAATTPPEQCRYDVCVVVEEGVALDTAVHQGKLPQGRYAVFTVEHTAEAVRDFWDKWQLYIARGGLRFDDTGLVLERYQAACIDRGDCELCVPVL